ncbi:MAG: FTR1 family protein [Alphaproteobacteria bacterium]
MLSAAIVVFREVFEIVLIVGIIIAATRDVPGRKRAIAAGFGAGLLGSALVAVFTGQISAYAEGLGQEYFNAGILLTAAAFIGWTVLWMKKHARHMKKHFETVGQSVAEGSAPLIALSAIIALAMLREGSEIVLFTYGMLAAGQSPSVIAMGSVMGITAGLIVGGLLYFGLINLSMRLFFRVTGAMLIMLVAGMVSQAFGFLVAAGAFEGLSSTIWDSSSLLSEQGLIGQSLGTLVGYTARPTIIQLIAYISTLALMIGSLKMIDKNINLTALLKGGIATTLALGVLTATPAHATKTVTSPQVNKGELEIKSKTGITHDDDSESKDGAVQQKFTAEYGVTDRLEIEAEAEFENSGDDDNTDFTALALESKFELTEPGQYWMDVAVKGAYEFNMTDGPDKIEGKLVLGKDSEMFKHRANIILEREVGDDAADETEVAISWSSRYRYNPMFEPGFEIYSEFGALSDGSEFDEESHRIGPVFYGKINSFKYEAGYLFGASDAAADGTLKAILAYEWYF